jgi:hypothetical protein
MAKKSAVTKTKEEKKPAVKEIAKKKIKIEASVVDAVKKSKKSKPKSDIDADPECIGTVRVSTFNYNKDLYLKLYLWLFGKVMKDYSFRKRKIRFFFEDTRWVKMRVRSAIVNLIFWKPYCDYRKTLSVEDVFNTDEISENTICDRMDRIIDEFRSIISSEQMCRSLRYIIESLAQIPLKFGTKIGNTLSLRDIIDLADRNPEFDAIIHTKYPDTMSTAEIEADINVRNSRAMEIIKSDTKSNFRVFLKAGGNINPGQLSQCIVSVGPRSDMYGNISPVIINTNFLMGLKTVSDYFLESFSCRKALIANKYQMSDSGYTGRQFDLLVIDSSLVDVDDCGTVHTISFHIPDEATLNMMDYKLIEEGRDSEGKPIIHEISSKKDKRLIGQTVKMRSPIVCALDQGSYCKACYGKMSYVTLGFHTGLIASHTVSEPISQAVLSTKHLIKTKSKEIMWGDMMKEYFLCDTNNAYILPELCRTGVSIGFYSEDIEDYLDIFTKGDDDDNDEQQQDTLFDYVSRFVINIDGENIRFNDMEVELYINQDFLDKLLKANVGDDGIIYIPLSGFDSSQPIFDANIENMEVSVFLQRIKKLLGIKSKTSYTTIEDLLQCLTATIVEIGISINIVHLEAIVYNMLRDPNIIVYRPDFKQANFPNYSILPTSNAIIYSSSLTTSLSFERLAAQFKMVTTYIKSKPGWLDPFFR